MKPDAPAPTRLPDVVLEPAPAIDAYLGGYLDALGLTPTLDDAVRYALLGGGKRVRPVLAWWSGVAVGGDGEATLPAGAAIEMVHAFSLVHDDLPAMDDDDLRRGRPTLHVRSGEAMAILAGDAMLAMAFGALRGAPDGLLGPLTDELLAGTNAMISGQIFDTLGGLGGEGTEVDRLETIHRNKTGALIRAACRMGGLLGGGGEEAIDHLSRYGEAIGLMFQVVDDLLDVEACASRTGKRTGKDAEAGKLTYPSVLGVEGARSAVARLGAEAREAIGAFGARGAALSDLAGYLERRGA
ncbi:MAG: polyprenyl synthetase family protein [Phycisphaerales bacterium JB059]